MTILDTHAWVWFAGTPHELSNKAQQTIDHETRLGVSAISCWEVAMLVSKQRLKLDRDVLLWVKRALALPKVQLIPLQPEIAVKAAQLSDHLPGDPADRIIVATSLICKARLISKDRRIRNAKVAPVVW